MFIVTTKVFFSRDDAYEYNMKEIHMINKSLKYRLIYILIPSLFLSLFAVIKVGNANTTLSGKCGAMISLKPLNEVYWHMVSSSPMSDGGSESISVDAMVYIDFDSRKIFLSVTNGTITRNIGALGTVTSYNTQTLPSVDISISSGSLPNSYLISDPSKTIPDLILLPVNSGNTFLIQAQNSKATGVCQKV
jgi:hypothetical protein